MLLTQLYLKGLYEMHTSCRGEQSSCILLAAVQRNETNGEDTERLTS